MNTEEVKERTFKINSFKEFPYYKMTEIVEAIENLGYKSTIVDNGNIVFEELQNKGVNNE